MATTEAHRQPDPRRFPAWQRTMATMLGMTLASAGLSDASEDTHRQVSAHVHGSAELTIVLEGTDLEINLTSPAISIVGFEDQATTAAARRVVDRAQAALESAEELFTFTGTRCALRRAVVDLSAISEVDEKAHDHASESCRELSHK